MIRFAVVGLLILNGVSPAEAKKKSRPKTNRANKVQIDAATRLQVFLDRANFSPGRIDGRYNDLTWKALALYRESRGEHPKTRHDNPGQTRMFRRMFLDSISAAWSRCSFPTQSPKRIFKVLDNCRAT